jgi:hypothetical protein
MDDIKNFIDDLGIAAFEANIKIAGIAVISDTGNIIHQTANWDLKKHTSKIMNIIKGENAIDLNGNNFSVNKKSSEGIIATNERGMGHVIFTPFQGGVLVSYAMPQSNPSNALSFLKPYAIRLNGKI